MQLQRAGVARRTQVIGTGQVQRAGEVDRASGAHDVARDRAGGKRAAQVQRAGGVHLDHIGGAAGGPTARSGERAGVGPQLAVVGPVGAVDRDDSPARVGLDGAVVGQPERGGAHEAALRAVHQDVGADVQYGAHVVGAQHAVGVGTPEDDLAGAAEELAAGAQEHDLGHIALRGDGHLAVGEHQAARGDVQEGVVVDHHVPGQRHPAQRGHARDQRGIGAGAGDDRRVLDLAAVAQRQVSSLNRQLSAIQRQRLGRARRSAADGVGIGAEHQVQCA